MLLVVYLSNKSTQKSNICCIICDKFTKRLMMKMIRISETLHDKLKMKSIRDRINLQETVNAILSKALS